MSTKLGALISGLKRAVVEAHNHLANQHIEELARFFQPAKEQPEGTPDNPTFPDGAWEPKVVVMNVQREVHSNDGGTRLEPHPVQVPLITLAPLRSLMIDRFELLTTLDLTVARLDESDLEHAEDMAEVSVNLGSKGPNTAEIKIVIQAADLPPGYTRLIGAYEKLLNAQLPT